MDCCDHVDVQVIFEQSELESWVNLSCFGFLDFKISDYTMYVHIIKHIQSTSCLCQSVYIYSPLLDKTYCSNKQ